MADGTRYGDAVEFDVDLHSIYSAYLGYFDSNAVDWWDKSWGGLFSTFADFLGFGWEVMVAIDARTGRAHIAVRREQIASFAKMIRTRFGESLPKDPPTVLPIIPVATRSLSLRRLLAVSEINTYRKIASSLAAAELAHLRTRVRAGDPEVIEQLFHAGGRYEGGEAGGPVRHNGAGYTWAAVKTTWWERGGQATGLIPGSGRTHASKTGKGVILDFGLAVLRCANIRAVNVWPPEPQSNYRKAHYIVEEWVDKRQNSNPPSHPRSYAFDKSRYILEKDVERIIDANVNSLASQETDNQANTLILVSAGDPEPLPVPMASMLPQNILHVDVLALEHRMLRRAFDAGNSNVPDRLYPLTSLGALLQTLQIPVPVWIPLGNAGNDAYYTLLAFHKLVMQEMRLPDILFTPPAGYRNDFPYASIGPPSAYRSSASFYNLNGMTPPLAPFAGSGERSRRSSGVSFGYQQPSPILAPVIGSNLSVNNITLNGTARRTSSNQLERMHPSRRGSSNQIEKFRGPANPVGSASAEALTTMRRPVTPPDQRAIPGSAPSTGQKERSQVPRSQTIYWDDMQYADRAPSDGSPQRAEDTPRPTARPTETMSRKSTSDARASSLGPNRSSLRPDNVIRPQAGRGVSWSDQSALPLPRAQSSTVIFQDGQPDSLSGGSSSHSSHMNGNLKTPVMPATQHRGSTGSSGKLSAMSSKDSPTMVESPMELKSPVPTAEKPKGPPVAGRPAKVKGSGSVKNLAGAISRFWVG